MKGRQRFWSRKPGRFWSYTDQNSKISIRGEFSGFGVAQPDHAILNGTRFQVQIKKHLTLFHQNLESRAVRKIQLRYQQPEDFHAPVYHMSISLFVTLRSLRPKYRFAGGFNSQAGHQGSRIPDLYSKRLLHIFFCYTENPRTPNRPRA
jgi:hypothetical protein